MIAAPSSASFRSNTYNSCLVPTSMPRVGSFNKIMRGLFISHFAMTTFCWLPPERAPTAKSVLAVLMAKRLIISSISFDSATRLTIPPFEMRCMAEKERLSRTDMGNIRPSVLRSSGIRAMPIFAALAIVGLLILTFLPSMSTSPEQPRKTPNNARSKSRWPCPSRPPRPTISPARTEREISLNRSVHDKLLVCKTGNFESVGFPGLGGNTFLYSRPIINSTTWVLVLLPAL